VRLVADIAKAYAEGRRSFRGFTKNINVVTTAGVPQDASMSPGNPVAQYYIGLPATATALAFSTDGGLNHGQSVGAGYQKFLHRMTLQTVTAAAAPLTLEVMDYLAFYPFIGMDSGVVPLTTAITIPRYTARDGIQMMLIEQNPYVGSAQVQITYTNQSGVAGRVTPIITLNTSTSIGTVATAAPAQVGQCGQFIALAQGDSGVSYPESIEIITGDVGVLCIVLVKPLVTLSIYDSTVPSDWDLWQLLGYLPQIKDDAYLNLLLKPAGNITGASILGNITTVWKAIPT
jgi:hypothetical protein